VGFCGNWTLEISVKQPVKVYSGMPVGQLIYFPVDGEIEVKYNQKKDAKYSQQPDKPIESMMWKTSFNLLSISLFFFDVFQPLPQWSVSLLCPVSFAASLAS
jgi:hypothetical protein